MGSAAYKPPGVRIMRVSIAIKDVMDHLLHNIHRLVFPAVLHPLRAAGAEPPGVRSKPVRLPGVTALGMLTLLLGLTGCGSQQSKQADSARPEVVKAHILRLMPSSVRDRPGWAADIAAAPSAQTLPASTDNICSVLAVIAQESNFNADPTVPNLAGIARTEIDRRAAARHIPAFVMHAALLLPSSDGRSYSTRLDKVRSEKDLSDLFDDFIDAVPLGQRLFGNLNPVHTGGPMQVSIAFAQAHAEHYPYPIPGTLRQEVFTRRGGIYFGLAHLLGYPAAYSQPLYRFADYNAGWYASRNAAFQNAVSRISGKKLALDGDLINYAADSPGQTELALRSVQQPLGLSASAIRQMLEQGERESFEKTALYRQVYALAERGGKWLPREMLPGIKLESPKITRDLTTAWFAKRVDSRYQRCVADDRGG